MQSTDTSDALFHFVGRQSRDDHEANYRILLKVLRDGCVSYAPHKCDWGEVSVKVNLDRHLISEELAVPTVTCFCDIPLTHLSIHARKYGKFGVSFKRAFLIAYGGRPVLYLPYVPHEHEEHALGGHRLLNKIEWSYRAFYDTDAGAVVREQGGEEGLHDVFLRDFVAYIKPFPASLPDDDAKNFYLEREWRKYGNLLFTVENVMHVVVAEGFENRLRCDAPAFGKLVVSCPASQENC